eukprot:GHVU01127386.1.p1 GENE.GHVU01127386.1~~GHVU01127386.1.p1  ORF type:complete len:149 (-),score=26.43 GHVU01127386.1:344-790(-)
MSTLDDIKRTFQQYDTDGNGFITYKEAHQVLHNELGFSEDKTRKLIQVYDRNGDGMLSYEEFIWFYWKIQEKKEELQRIFKKFDKDDNNSIYFDEARAVQRDFKFSDSEILTLMKAHDHNNDGHLQYQEFVHFWNACGTLFVVECLSL